MVAGRVVKENEVRETPAQYEQLSIFDMEDAAEAERKKAAEAAALAKEKKIQKAMIDIKKKHGKNAILKGMNFEEGATGKDQNRKIGGHQA